MTIDEAKLLTPGDKVRHSGVWAYRIGPPKVFEVLSNTDSQIRVSDRGFVSLYQWSGCSTFVTNEFFAACRITQ